MIPFFNRVNPLALSGAELDWFLSQGWYRMRQSLFTSSHVDLGAIYRVHWLRFPVFEIINRSSHKRIRRKNKRFRVSITDFIEIQEEHRMLHQRYREAIDFDGAWSIEECLLGETEVMNNIFQTKCISVYDEGRLIAAGYFDLGEKTAASILHFFDPEYNYFSPGKFMILITLDYLKKLGVEYYYPGYLVSGVKKMNYKLFLGSALAQYFDPLTGIWKPFETSILDANPKDILL